MHKRLHSLQKCVLIYASVINPPPPPIWLKARQEQKGSILVHPGTKKIWSLAEAIAKGAIFSRNPSEIEREREGEGSETNLLDLLGGDAGRRRHRGGGGPRRHGHLLLHLAAAASSSSSCLSFLVEGGFGGCFVLFEVSPVVSAWFGLCSERKLPESEEEGRLRIYPCWWTMRFVSLPPPSAVVDFRL